MHHQVVGEPAGGRRSQMPHQTVQLLAIHAPQGVQGVLRGDHPIVGGAIGGLAVQVCVPWETGRWACDRTTESGLPVGLSLHQSHRVQGGDRNGWRGEFHNVRSEWRRWWEINPQIDLKESLKGSVNMFAVSFLPTVTGHIWLFLHYRFLYWYFCISHWLMWCHVFPCTTHISNNWITVLCCQATVNPI